MPAPTTRSIPSSNVAKYSLALTPSDSTSLAVPCSAVWVGAAGTVVIVQPDDSLATFVGAQAGSIIPNPCKRVNATGTTASSLMAMYQ